MSDIEPGKLEVQLNTCNALERPDGGAIYLKGEDQFYGEKVTWSKLKLILSVSQIIETRNAKFFHHA